MVIAVIMMMAVFLSIFSFCGVGNDTPEKVDGITQSTVDRTPMAGKYITPIDTYFETKTNRLQITDDLSVDDSMRRFFEKTGVQPYLYVIDNVGGNTKPTTKAVMEEGFRKYGELFGSDEGHLLVTVCCYSGYDYDFYVDLIVGNNASTVIDDEACRILRDCLVRDLEACQYGRMTVDEALANAFSDAASRIMGGAVKTSSGGVAWLPAVLIVVVIALVIAVIVAGTKKKKNPPSDKGNGDSSPYGAGVYNGD